MEKFIKSTGIEVQIDNEVTEDGRYSPRFVDEIVDEIDLIEDKKDSLFSKYMFIIRTSFDDYKKLHILEIKFSCVK